jgi:hypothetical protein
LDVRGEELQDGEYYGLHEQVIGWTFRLGSRTRGQISARMFQEGDSSSEGRRFRLWRFRAHL